MPRFAQVAADPDATLDVLARARRSSATSTLRHFVVGHFGTDPPVLLDPFAGGGQVETDSRLNSKPVKRDSTACLLHVVA